MVGRYTLDNITLTTCMAKIHSTTYPPYYGLVHGIEPICRDDLQQDGSSNQCISIYMAILSLGNKC